MIMKIMDFVKEFSTAIILTIIVVIFLIVFAFIKNTLVPGQTIDAPIIFLAILPLVIYLVTSGKLLEFKGGGFEFKFNNASNADISFKSEEIAFVDEEVIYKSNLDRLRDIILPEIEKKHISTISVIPGTGSYDYGASKVYLEELTKFDFFKYVLFINYDKTFKGYMHARNLQAQLLDEVKGKEIISKINSGNIESIPGFRKEYTLDRTSNKEALETMEKLGITDIAVVDKDMKFKGFTNQVFITSRILTNLMTKTVKNLTG